LISGGSASSVGDLELSAAEVVALRFPSELESAEAQPQVDAADAGVGSSHHMS
jgi:hypothetical protein